MSIQWSRIVEELSTPLEDEQHPQLHPTSQYTEHTDDLQNTEQPSTAPTTPPQPSPQLPHTIHNNNSHTPAMHQRNQPHRPHRKRNNRDSSTHVAHPWNSHDDTNLPSGDLLTKTKAHNTLRLYFQNANGISKNQWLDWTNASSQINNLQIDITGIAETNVSWSEPR
jgi:hypothetical protein